VKLNSVRIEKLSLRDYGIFSDMNEIMFDSRRTLIIGGGGTGKTTIFNALVNLGPAKRITAHMHAEHPEMSVEVEISGNRTLIKDYRNIIFLNGESVCLFANSFYDQTLNTLEDETRAIFQTILHHKSHKIKMHRNLSPKLMAAGERSCLGYAVVFALRKIRDLDVPVVMESPYGLMDMETRTGFSEFLKNEPCQQILLGTETEFMEVEDKPHYLLEYSNGNSRVRKI
jgi:hypothetical protein